MTNRFVVAPGQVVYHPKTRRAMREGEEIKVSEQRMDTLKDLIKHGKVQLYSEAEPSQEEKAKAAMDALLTPSKDEAKANSEKTQQQLEEEAAKLAEALRAVEEKEAAEAQEKAEALAKAQAEGAAREAEAKALLEAQAAAAKESAPVDPKVPGPWALDPATLEGVSLEDLHLMIIDRDDTIASEDMPATVEESIAFLSRSFVPA